MAFKSGQATKDALDAAHAKAIAQQRANTPVPGAHAPAPVAATKKSFPVRMKKLPRSKKA